MPGERWGQRRGRGGARGHRTQQSASRRQVSRFLEPCLLLLLSEEATHGYDLLNALQPFGFAPDAADSSVVYRTLREMEGAGWVRSQWDTAGSGAPRRVYTVTTDGGKQLGRWIDDLRLARDEIDYLIENYTKQTATGSSH